MPTYVELAVILVSEAAFFLRLPLGVSLSTSNSYSFSTSVGTNRTSGSSSIGLGNVMWILSVLSVGVLL